MLSVQIFRFLLSVNKVLYYFQNFYGPKEIYVYLRVQFHAHLCFDKIIGDFSRAQFGLACHLTLNI